MPPAPERDASRLGVASAAAVAGLCLAYAVVLTGGLLTLPSPDQPIRDPWFTWMEVLILAIAPAMVAFTVALWHRVEPGARPVAALGVAFMAMCAVVTCSVHFSILVLSREPAFAGEPWTRLVFPFTWPSVVYALDILAWDVFFAGAAACEALAVRGRGRARVVRVLLLLSAALALIGLVGVPLGDMQWRNIGILGYAVVFPAAAVASMRLFRG